MQPNLLPEEITMADQQVPITIAEVTDPDEISKARAQDERFARNSAWLQMHATEIYTQYRGKCICIADVVCLLGQRHRYTIEQD